MAKRTPDQRWRDEVADRYLAFRLSLDFKRLRRRGLRALGRTRLLDNQEWWELSRGLMTKDGYQSFRRECKVLADRMGLATWTLEMACLLKGYDPDTSPFPVEEGRPRVQVVTEATDPLFLGWLRYELWNLGQLVFDMKVRPRIAESFVRVWGMARVSIHRSGGAETALIEIPFPTKPDRTLMDEHRPPRHRAFFTRVEAPGGYPPEARSELVRMTALLERELFKKLGYPARERLRASSAVKDARRLKVGRRLVKSEIGDLSEDLYGQGAAKDHRARGRVRSRRQRATRRLRSLQKG